MIETMLEPFNYQLAPDTRSPVPSSNTPAAANAPTPRRHHTRTVRDSPTDAVQRQHRATEPRSIPTTRSHTPGSVGSRTQHSADGSPPLPASMMTANLQRHEQLPRGEYFTSPTSDPSSSAIPPQQPPADIPRLQKSRTIRYDDTTAPSAASGSSSASTARPQRPSRGSTRTTSVSGGVQVVLNEQGSWSDMAGSSQNLVATPTGEDSRAEAKPTGMLGIFSRKKGRDRSPKGKQRERGVLGKEGARVVVGH